MNNDQLKSAVDLLKESIEYVPDEEDDVYVVEFSLKQIEALLEALEKPTRESCPCHFLDKPCSDICTCVHPMSSGGCLYCCTYGSVMQQKDKANLIQKALEQNETSDDCQDSLIEFILGTNLESMTSQQIAFALQEKYVITRREK